MAAIGLICPETSGHLNPMATLGRELQRRGHRVALVGLVDARAKAEECGFDFFPVGEAEFPAGSMAHFTNRLGELRGLAGLRCAIEHSTRTTHLLMRDAIPAVRNAGFDLLLVDQAVLAGGTVAEAAGIPFVNVCCALLMNSSRDAPPWVTGWKFRTTWTARLRYRGCRTLFRWLRDPCWNVIDAYRRQWGMPVFRSVDDYYSRWAQLSQQPAEFEYPRRLPECFHFVGPLFRPQDRPPRDFPWERLDGRPLVYASLGTLQNRVPRLFETIARACHGVADAVGHAASVPHDGVPHKSGVQLVISVNREVEPSLHRLPGSPIVVELAPQGELLKRAALAITHGGMNTVLEALSHGVPLVAVPITNDQPGVAARIAWSGAGAVVPVSMLKAGRLGAAVRRVLTEPSYAQHAVRLKEAIVGTDGVALAADIVEQVLTTGRPVCRPFPENSQSTPTALASEEVLK